MHAVRRELVYAQAHAAWLDLWPVFLPSPCTNAEYEELMRVALARARVERVTDVAFGDLFLEDVRDYRIRHMAGTGIAPLFPLWMSAEETPALAARMLDGGVRAVLTCVDPRQLPESFVGRQYNRTLLADLPPSVDPCGERGEFHSFCYAGPMFKSEIAVTVGEVVTRDGFCFADLVPTVDPISTVHSRA
jgi:diphthamide synthase (EF-2-diphthine--ammonia ligase)